MRHLDEYSFDGVVNWAWGLGNEVCGYRVGRLEAMSADAHFIPTSKCDVTSRGHQVIDVRGFGEMMSVREVWSRPEKIPKLQIAVTFGAGG